ncbi:MAG: group III truncated hemoglobin [Parvibaculaceae bacterium]
MAVKQAVELETGINEAMVKELVHYFYDRIRDDEMLAPVFNARISDWDKHLNQMCDFWSSVVLLSGRYHGQPMQKHAPLPVGGIHFDHWLELFRTSAREICPPLAATHFITRAERIAESLELGIAGARGQMLQRGERLCPIAD